MKSFYDLVSPDASYLNRHLVAQGLVGSSWWARLFHQSLLVVESFENNYKHENILKYDFISYESTHDAYQAYFTCFGSYIW